jgi:hypothetical protein
MLEINIHNVEEIIFENNGIWKELNHFMNFRNQWKLGKFHPSLRPMSKRALLDFLNNASKEDEIIVSKFLNTNVTINKLDYNLVKNYEFDVENMENNLNLLKNEFYNFFTISRKDKKVNVTFWR